MKIFLDTEFTELSKNGELISIGLISNDSRSFYAELNDFDRENVSEWIKENVINNLLFSHPNYCVEAPHLVNDKMIYEEDDKEIELDYFYGFDTELIGDKKLVGEKLRRWLGQFKEIEIWGDCLAFDWIHFIDLIGDTAFDLPSNINYIPQDICTLFKMKHIDPDISREDFAGNRVVGDKHNSLYDAMVIRECYRKLINIH